MDYSLLGSSIHGILQATILEWVVIPSPGDLPCPGIGSVSSLLQADSSPDEPGLPWCLSVKLPYDPAIPLLGIYPGKTIVQKDTCTPMFTAALFTIARTWKQPGCPLTSEWIKQMWYIYKVEYYSVIKRNEFESILGR